VREVCSHLPQQKAYPCSPPAPACLPTSFSPRPLPGFRKSPHGVQGGEAEKEGLEVAAQLVWAQWAGRGSLC
jgi:hypothetical protein